MHCIELTTLCYRVSTGLKIYAASQGGILLFINAFYDSNSLLRHMIRIGTADIRKNSPDISIHPDEPSKKFIEAKKNARIAFQDSPPTFHEIRSSTARMYEKEKGKIYRRNCSGINLKKGPNIKIRENFGSPPKIFKIKPKKDRMRILHIKIKQLMD